MGQFWLVGVAWEQHGRELVLVAAILSALAVIWRYAIRPAYRFVKGIETFAQRVETALGYVEGQMRNNGGSSLLDKVEQTAEKVTLLVERTDVLESRFADHRASEALVADIRTTQERSS